MRYISTILFKGWEVPKELGEISTTEEMISYLSQKALTHHYYRHYSSFQKISTIYETKKIYLSDGKNWNDLIDQKNFTNTNNSYKRFAVCLSFSKSENIAMWMLYSQNNGAMVEFNRSTIKNILNIDNIELGFFCGNVFNIVQDLSRNDFRIEITDIIYFSDEIESSDKKKTGTVYVKRSDDVCRELKKHIIDNISYQKKTLPWAYENECRIVVSISNKLIKDNRIDTVAISLGNNSKLSFFDSPNSKNKRFENHSKLYGLINWDLCSECKKELSYD